MREEAVRIQTLQSSTDAADRSLMSSAMEVARLQTESEVQLAELKASREALADSEAQGRRLAEAAAEAEAARLAAEQSAESDRSHDLDAQPTANHSALRTHCLCGDARC